MENGDNGFLRLLCDLYLVALLAALPLYIGEGYWNLGDTKYMLFKNITLLCLGIWLAVGLSMGIWQAAKQAGSRKAGKSGRQGLSIVDCAMASYGICVVLSALCSQYGELAWKGYDGWYMGAVSQILFVGIYFFVSRQYGGERWPLYLGEAALFAVTLLGLLHRLGIDPLGLLKYWNYKKWEYSHMLSTLGNINWLCGYYSVALALGVVHFLWEERVWLKAILYVAAVMSFVLLGVQGSQGGLLILAVCVVVCLFLGRRRRELLQGVWALLTGFFLCMPIMGWMMDLRGNLAAVVADGNVFDSVKWYAWLIAAAACLVACLCCRRKRRSFLYRRPIKILLLAGLAIGLALAGWGLLLRGIDDSFGNGRGLLWRIAVQGFRETDLKGKLLGAGPDCYAEAVFNRLGAGTDVWKGERWEHAVFTNAHNEFLSQLCNVGILGTVSYIAVFLTGLWRYGRGCAEDQGRSPDTCYLWIGLLAIAMYGAHSLISFQQVLNAPLLFLVLGICEERLRLKEKS